MSKTSTFFAKASLAAFVAVACMRGAEAKDGYRVLYFFQGGQDGIGATPGLIVGQDGSLFGTTAQGGGSGCTDGQGCGTIYQISPRGNETVLYRFTGIPDGFYPQSGLVSDQTGSLYGTTEYGGQNGCQFNLGCGTLFKLATDQTESVLYAFQYGGNPDSGLARDKRGNLFGVIPNTYGNTGCGGLGCGAAFEFSHNAKYKVLHRFIGGNDAATPQGNLIADSNGDFYGTSYDGGSGTKCSSRFGGGCGTVFKLTPSGAVTVLYEFLGGKDGAHPYGPVALGPSGNIYGTTEYGGGGNGCGDGCGTVFKVSPSGKETVLYAFKNPKDGYYPVWGPVLDDAGNLYGTTVDGGSSCADIGCGTIFRLSPDGTKTTLHVIHDWSSEGTAPVGLARDKKGNLFGTVLGGGPRNTYGGVFEIKAQK